MDCFACVSDDTARNDDKEVVCGLERAARATRRGSNDFFLSSLRANEMSVAI